MLTSLLVIIYWVLPVPSIEEKETFSLFFFFFKLWTLNKSVYPSGTNSLISRRRKLEKINSKVSFYSKIPGLFFKWEVFLTQLFVYFNSSFGVFVTHNFKKKKQTLEMYVWLYPNNLVQISSLEKIKPTNLPFQNVSQIAFELLELILKTRLDFPRF